VAGRTERGRGGDPAPSPDAGDRGYPAPGEVLRRLRAQRGWSLREVGERCGLSASFLGAVERGESDIALERLARLASVFDHDVGSFLGYSSRRAQPRFLGAGDRVVVDRGDGVAYEVIRVPTLGFELVRVSLAPHAAFADEFAHEGVDVTLVTEGTVTATYNGVDHVLETGACVLWSGGYRHTFRNDGDRAAAYVVVVTAMLY
jgi:transcriptional regulator with XRE-family HTH domain